MMSQAVARGRKRMGAYRRRNDVTRGLFWLCLWCIDYNTTIAFMVMGLVSCCFDPVEKTLNNFCGDHWQFIKHLLGTSSPFLNLDLLR
ncbi:hypothetical protein L1987_17192 [Smallanthus sonchifolius]|uniref:Uncharacterized protein n=1 Tax=Smallanthus sonchifolius TaxID=185202 RepID=A0ACB9IWK5_9ASTR|nr:hypothetical protein L1987_17192 [Smallanthus sonchifolius]